MLTRSTSSKASAPDLWAYLVSSDSLLERADSYTKCNSIPEKGKVTWDALVFLRSRPREGSH